MLMLYIGHLKIGQKDPNGDHVIKKIIIGRKKKIFYKKNYLLVISTLFRLILETFSLHNYNDGKRRTFAHTLLQDLRNN